MNFQDGIDCGGAYIKLLSDTGDLSLVGSEETLLLMSTTVGCFGKK